MPKKEKSKDKVIQRECKHHGVTEFGLEGRGYHRCRKCRYEKTQRWYRSQKQKYLDYKGGKCERCGYNKCNAALEFHHLDPSKKEFRLSYSRKGFEKVKKELDKCILVCANCHREIHHNES